MEKLFIGVDGGGTETLGILTNETGVILATAKVGASNYQAVGAENLKVELESLFSQLGVDLTGKDKMVEGIYLGLAGAGRESDKQEIRAIFKNAPYVNQLNVDSDAMIALSGAFSGAPGIIIIAGTGAICFGKSADDHVVRSGGWGYLLGDEGSGFFMGQQAIMAALKDLDGRGPKTRLRAAIEKRFNLKQIDLIIPKIYKGEIDRPTIASIGPIVFELAADNDAVATELVSRTGKEQGKMARAVAEKLNLNNQKIQIGLIGGVFNRRDVLESEIIKQLSDLSGDIEIGEPQNPPVIGAAILAMKNSGVALTEKILGNFSQAELLKTSGK
ncbi:hypothetical protein KAH55_02910 [bacterium]|nr:hypothetical protein [bacterium]